MSLFIKIFKKSFDDYKKDPLAIFLFGLADISTFSLTLIPIVGIFIGSFFLPRVLGWYYNKTIGNISPNYKLTFKIWFFFILLHHVSVLLFLSPYITEIFNYILNLNMEYIIQILLNTLPLLSIPLLIIWLFFFYPAYASILGKIKNFEINLKKSFILLVYTLIWNITSLILSIILFILPIIGPILSILFILFVYQQIFNLIIANAIIL